MSQILISAPSTTPVRATSPPLQIVIHKGTACLSLQPRSLNVGLILRTDANEYSSSDSQIQFGLMSALAVRKRNVIFVEYIVWGIAITEDCCIPIHFQHLFPSHLLLNEHDGNR